MGERCGQEPVLGGLRFTVSASSLDDHRTTHWNECRRVAADGPRQIEGPLDLGWVSHHREPRSDETPESLPSVRTIDNSSDCRTSAGEQQPCDRCLRTQIEYPCLSDGVQSPSYGVEKRVEVPTPSESVSEDA